MPSIATSRFKKLQETEKEAKFYFIKNYQNITIFKNAKLEDARLWRDVYDFQIKLKDKMLLLKLRGYKTKVGSIQTIQINCHAKSLECK